MPEKTYPDKEVCYSREEGCGWAKKEGYNPSGSSQAFSTPNTTFNLTVTELHSVIPLGRTAGALREGWTGIMRDHLRRIIPHTTWYFKRSAFSHPDTRKRAAPLFKCEAVCAERSCPNTIKMCATKADPLRVTVNFGQSMCVHMSRRKLFNNTNYTNYTNVSYKDEPRSKPTLKRPITRSPVTSLPCDIKRPVAVRLVDRRTSYCRLRSIENAPSAFHVVALPPRSPTTPELDIKTEHIQLPLKQEYLQHYPTFTSPENYRSLITSSSPEMYKKRSHDSLESELYTNPGLCYAEEYRPKRQKIEMVHLVS